MTNECFNAAKLFIKNLFTLMLSEYAFMFNISGEGTDSSVSDWEFISCAVKVIFCELQLLCTGG